MDLLKAEAETHYQCQCRIRSFADDLLRSFFADDLYAFSTLQA